MIKHQNNTVQNHNQKDQSLKDPIISNNDKKS